MSLQAPVNKIVPMVNVPDVVETLEWYVSIGFTEVGRFDDAGVVNWGKLSFGKAELMLATGGKVGEHDTSLWFYTSDVEELYRQMKARELFFVEELYEPFYGGRQFGIRDLNGYNLFFLQPAIA